jgi:hypothetical protein
MRTDALLTSRRRASLFTVKTFLHLRFFDAHILAFRCVSLLTDHPRSKYQTDDLTHVMTLLSVCRNGMPQSLYDISC